MNEKLFVSGVAFFGVTNGDGVKWGNSLQGTVTDYFAGQSVTVERTPTGVEVYATPEKPYPLSDVLQDKDQYLNAIALIGAVLFAVFCVLATLPH